MTRREEWNKLRDSGSLYVYAKRGPHFLLNVRDNEISRDIYVSGSVESRKLSLALALLGLTRVDHLVDVGANLGEISICAVTSGLAQRVTAIEPDPENFRLLETNAALNGLLGTAAFAAHQAAAGTGIPETLQLVRNTENYGDHQIASGDRTDRTTNLVVTHVALDRIVELKANETALLFVDVQGFEVEVLRGAKQLLQRRCPLVLEISPRHLEQYGSLDVLLELTNHYEGYFDLGLHRPQLQSLSELQARFSDLKSRSRHTDIVIC